MNKNVKTDTRMARALGWASIGIGLMEIAAPRYLENMLGLGGKRRYQGVLRVLGLREIMQGVSILSCQDRPSTELKASVWSRVAGDVIDLAMLGAAARQSRRPVGLAAATAMVLGIGAMDLACAQSLQQYDDTGRQREPSPRRRRRVSSEYVQPELEPSHR